MWRAQAKAGHAASGTRRASACQGCLPGPACRLQTEGSPQTRHMFLGDPQELYPAVTLLQGPSEQRAVRGGGQAGSRAETPCWAQTPSWRELEGGWKGSSLL